MLGGDYVTKSKMAFVVFVHRYAMMLRCWSEEPDDRPTFCEVFEKLETFLNMQNTKTQLRSRQRQHVPSSIRVSNSNNFLSNGFSWLARAEHATRKYVTDRLVA